jgi:hypothetical protein
MLYAAAPDRCQVKRECRGQTEQAAQLAAQTRYEEALALYQRAFESSEEPRLLVNIGRCHYRIGRARKALEFYDAFRKAEPEPEPELAARLGQFIAEAKIAIASDQGSSAEEKEAAAPPEPIEEPPPAPLLPVTESTGLHRTLWGRPLWRLSVGAGAFGLGALFIGIGAGAVSANGRCVTPSMSAVGLCAAMIDADGQRSTVVLDGITPGVPLLVIGSLLAVGGVVLAVLPPRRPPAARAALGGR